MTRGPKRGKAPCRCDRCRHHDMTDDYRRKIDRAVNRPPNQCVRSNRDTTGRFAHPRLLTFCSHRARQPGNFSERPGRKACFAALDAQLAAPPVALLRPDVSDPRHPGSRRQIATSIAASFPNAGRLRKLTREGQIMGPIDIVGSMRWPEARHWFAPDDEPAKNPRSPQTPWRSPPRAPVTRVPR